MCDASCAEEVIRLVAVKGVRFLMWLRIHDTEELVDEASFSSDLGMALVRCGTLGDSGTSEDPEAMSEHQGKSNAHLERKFTYQLFHTPPDCPPPFPVAPAVLPSSPLPS